MKSPPFLGHAFILGQSAAKGAGHEVIVAHAPNVPLIALHKEKSTWGKTLLLLVEDRLRH